MLQTWSKSVIVIETDKCNFNNFVVINFSTRRKKTGPFMQQCKKYDHFGKFDILPGKSHMLANTEYFARG